MKKPVILVAMAVYLPGYKAGGPVQSVCHLVAALGDEFEFKIVTGDRDLGGRAPYPGVKYNIWNKVGLAQVRYLAPGEQGLAVWRRLMRDIDYDVLYVNGLWHPRFALAPLLVNRLGGRRPVVQAVRGMLGAAAVTQKAWKKRVCLLGFYRLGGLARRTVWQCSSDQEAAEVRRYLGGGPRTAVVCNVPGGERVARPVATKQPNRLRLAFLSRIAPKKNLDGALRSLAMCRSEVQFDIFGVREDGEYWRQCEALMARLPGHIQAKYRGELAPDQVVERLSGYDGLFFPTRHENFGHVIHEGLRAGLPALIGDQTPWHELERRGAGWELDAMDHGGFARLIDWLAGLTAQEFYGYKERALDYGSRFSGENEIVERNRRLFREVLE